MIISLQTSEQMYVQEAPDVPEGRQRMAVRDQNGYETNAVYLEAKNGAWYLCTTKKTRVLQDQVAVDSIKIKIDQPYLMENVQKQAQLYFQAHSEDSYFKFEKYQLSKEGRTVIRIGNNPDVELYYPFSELKQQIALQYDKGIWTISCQKPEKGIYVNGAAVHSGKLSVGDRIYIKGLILIVEGKRISVNQSKIRYQWKDGIVKDFRNVPSDAKVPEKKAERAAAKEWEMYEPAPRTNKKVIVPPRYVIDPPPDRAIKDEMPMPMVVGPSMTMGIASLATGGVSIVTAIMDQNFMRAIPSVTMAVGMLGGSILWPLITKSWKRKQERKKEDERQSKYQAYLNHFENRFIEEGQRQKAIWEENYITVNSCITRINSSMLWNRNKNHDDFLRIRIGTGTAVMEADFDFPEEHFNINKDNLVREMRRLRDKPRCLEEIPITESLIDSPYWGIVGERGGVISYTKGILAQLVTYYGYQDIKLVFLINKTEEMMWHFCKYLPHAWDDDKTFRYLAYDEMDVMELSAVLDKELAKRRIEKQTAVFSGGEQEEQKKSVFITIVADRTLAEQAAFLKHIFQSPLYADFSVIYLADTISNLPPQCTHIFEVRKNNVRVSNMKESTAAEVIADIQITASMDDIAGRLFAKKLRGNNKAFELPSSLTYQQYFGIHDVLDLNFSDIWAKNDSYFSLRAALGVDEDGNTCYLDIHEKAHGPHGLIAGMTGSGKSEFILTYLLSLAINYHPDDISFILIDYKGGGMADTFEKLPHTAGIITNLDGAMIHRSLVSLKSELERREEIFRDTSKKLEISNIDIYKYQKAYHNKQVDKPLPHLLIISDEFAELKSQQPEFMTQLVSTARIGRSLGVHLILATQKPSGVVNEQIWSNSRFHICLKVQDEKDSKEMLRRPDAAFLVERGRFYLQVGNDEVFMKGQSAYSGAEYEVLDNDEFHSSEEITLVDHLGRATQTVFRKKSVKDERSRKQIDAICSYIEEYARKEQIEPHRIWLDPLPKIISFEDLKKNYPRKGLKPYELDVLLGEYDIPKEQKRGEFRLALTGAGNVQIIGMQGSGEENFLQAICYTLIEQYSPEWLNLYILDCGSGVMRGLFHEAPQVGDVVNADDEERAVNLFRMLSSELRKRRKLCSEAGGTYKTWCSENMPKGNSMPNIVVIINNYASFTEAYGQLSDSLVYLSREGVQYGITFIVTAVSASVFRSTVSRYYTQRYALQFSNPVEYVDVIGNTKGMTIESNPARGLFKAENRELYEFQVALRVDTEVVTADSSDEEQGKKKSGIDWNAALDKASKDMAESCKKLCGDCRQRYQTAAKKIPVLPEHVYWKQAPERMTLETGIFAGISAKRLRPQRFDTSNYVVHMILASRKQTVNSFFYGLTELLAKRKQGKIILFDFAKAYESYPIPEGISYWSDEPIKAYDQEIHPLVARANKIAHGEIERIDPVFVLIPAFQAWMADSIKAVDKKVKDTSAKETGKRQVETLQSMLVKLTPKHGVWFFLGDTAAAAKEYSSKTWYTKKRGLWIGNDIANQDVLDNSGISYSERSRKIGAEKGYLISEEKIVLLKVLQGEHLPEEAEEEDDE